MLQIELKLVPDPDMYIFFEKGTRGGISSISNRYRKTYNKYLKSYYPKEESKHIICLDANNLYGYVMSKFFQKMGSNGYILKSLTLMNMLTIVQMYVFSKFILNIQKKYEIYTIITL